MTNPDYRHYILIADRSGSMKVMAAEANNGIEHFLSEQMKIGGKATVSLYQFDTEHDTVFDFTPLALAAAAGYVLLPRGGTALNDALGFAITREGETLARMTEDGRPGKVLMLIVTDGQENSSHEYTKVQVKDLITAQHEKWQWEISYIGANVDAFAEAQGMGIAAASSMGYAATTGGQKAAWRGASAASVRYSSGQSANLSYTEDERDAAEEK